MMKALGWLSLVAGIWNSAFKFIHASDYFTTPSGYPFIALFAGLVVSGLFFLARRGIREGLDWGREMGQMALALFYIVAMLGMIFVPQLKNPPPAFFLVLFGVFAGVPTIAGLVYLQRLRFTTKSDADTVAAAEPGGKYAECAPWQAQVVVYLLLVVSIIAALSQVPDSVRVMLFLFVGVFMVAASMIAMNFFPSSFQRENHLLSSRVGGLRTILSHSPFPLTRLLVYEEGIEIRHFSRRYFIPYEKLHEPEIGGTFSTQLPIDSDLPGVPCAMTFTSLDLDPAAEAVRQAYACRLHLPTPPPRK